MTSAHTTINPAAQNSAIVSASLITDSAPPVRMKVQASAAGEMKAQNMG